MTPIEQFFDWFEHTDLSTWVRGDSLFVFPLFLTVHTIGMGLLAGTSSAIDLRILGYARGIPLAALAKFYPVLWFALAANAASGILLFAGYPYKAFTNPDFYIKLSLIALAIFLVVKIRREVLLAPDAEAAARSPRGRRLATLSIAVWLAVILAGRLLAYTFSWLRVGIPGGF
jgi:Family of unknown function (DUF6644)